MKMKATNRFIKFFGPLTVTSSHFGKDIICNKYDPRTFSALDTYTDNMPVERHAMYTLSIVDTCASLASGSRYEYIDGRPYPIIYSVQKKLDYWIAREWDVARILKYMQEERGVPKHDVLIVDEWLHEVYPNKQEFGVSPKIREFCNFKRTR